MPRVIGIDLGTTNTAVAVVDGGRPRVLEDERGYKVLPSVVSAKGEGRFVVGQAAHNLIITNPDRTVYATKRLMGRRFDSPEVQHVLSRVQYKLRPAPDGTVQMLVGDQWMTPIEVAAVILQVARSIAERTLGDTVDDTVITVPAYFNHLQRKATLEAAHLAGLPCERLLNEPTAAALAYGHKKNLDRTMVIFDLGGGTFDVSVLRLSQGIYEILATTGDTFLGGEDFDYRVVDHLADLFQTRTGVDARQDRAALQRLKDAAERAKCELSFSDRAEVLVPHLAPGQTLEAVLARTTLESLTADLIDRCIEIARRAVADAGLSLTDIGDVILVGGQTRMPRVREAVAGLFGREPNRSVHPEEVVAIGAAVHAANLGDGDRAPTVLMDVTPFDVGIDTAGGMFVPVITRNARIPAAETKVFATIADQQEVVRITVRQGDNRTAVQNEFLGEFLMEGLTPAPRLQTKVDVTFRIDSNGMLHVAATERGTGEKKAITIRNYAEHARSPKFPDAEQAKADDVMRRLRAAQGADGGAKGEKARGTKKLGIIDRLLRRGPAKPAAKPTPAAPTPAAPTPASVEAGPPLEAVAAAVVAGGVAGAAAASLAATTSAAATSAGATSLSATSAGATSLGATSGGSAAPTGGAGGWLGDRGDEASVIEAFSGINSTDAVDDVEDDAALDALLAPPPPAADGVILDALVEPLPDAPLVDATDGLALDVGLAPIEEDAYGDEGAFASLGVGGLADDDPFANLDEPMGDLAAALDSGRDLSELFGEIGIDDVELGGPSAPADPFAAAPATTAKQASADPFADVPAFEIDPFAAPPAAPSDPFGSIAEAPLVPDFEIGSADAAEGLDSLASDLFADLPSPEPLDISPPAAASADPFASLPQETGFERIDHAEEPVVALAGAPALALEEQDIGPGELLDGEVDIDLGELDVGLDNFDLSALDELHATPADADPFASAPPAAPEAFDPFAALDLTPGETDSLSLDFEELPELTDDAAPFQTLAPSPAPEPPELLPDPTDVEASGFALLDPDTNVRAILGAVRTPAPEVETVPGSALDDAAAQALVTFHPGSDVRTAGPDPVPEPPAAPRRPARVKLHYDDPAVLVAECRENVLRGGAFIRTARPLPVGRECVFEIDAPGIPEAIVVPATVTFVASAGPAQESGMGVEYRLGDDDRRRIEQALARV